MRNLRISTRSGSPFVAAALLLACSGGSFDDPVVNGGASSGGESAGSSNSAGSHAGSAATAGANSGASGGNTSAGSSGSGNGASAGTSAQGGGSGGRSGAAGSGGSSVGTRADAYHVEGRNLYDRCGERVVLRGVNHPTMYVDRAGDAFPQIAMTGANAVRLFWAAGNGVPIAESEAAIQRAIQSGLIPMLEMHDSTCKWDMQAIVSYWTSPEAVALIRRYQGNLLVNIANEPSVPDESQFATLYGPIVRSLRDAGIHTPLVIDASACGRSSASLLSHGPALLAADPDHNLIFSWHLYDPLTTTQITEILERSVALNLPFIVGEFANRSPPGCGSTVQYQHMLAETQRLGIGWLAWSWGDNSSSAWWNTDCWEFDMTRTFEFSSLERWGLDVAVGNAASIQHTATRPHSMMAGSCP